jgi:hypothetical protein
MIKLRTVVLTFVAVFALSAVPAPAGDGANCGLRLSADAAFQRIDRAPSAGAAKICAIYLNTLETPLVG